jgi:hypothetical protein
MKGTELLCQHREAVLAAFRETGSEKKAIELLISQGILDAEKPRAFSGKIVYFVAGCENAPKIASDASDEKPHTQLPLDAFQEVREEMRKEIDAIQGKAESRISELQAELKETRLKLQAVTEKHLKLTADYSSLKDRHAAVCRTMHTPPLLETIVYGPDIPLNFEGWTVQKRKNQKGFFLRKTIKGKHHAIHLPETDGVGFDPDAARQRIADRLEKLNA